MKTFRNCRKYLKKDPNLQQNRIACSVALTGLKLGVAY